jgi:hypothetical protein
MAADTVAKNYPRGEQRTWNVRLTDEKVREIRRDYLPQVCGYKTLGIRYGVHWATIRAVIKRKTWAHI